MIIAHLTAQLSTAVHLIMSCSHISLVQQKTENITSNHQGADSYRTVYLPSVEFVLYKLLTDSHEIKITDVLCSYSKLPEVPRRKQVLSKLDFSVTMRTFVLTASEKKLLMFVLK